MSSPNTGIITVWWVVHVILVSAQVLLVLTTGLWSLGLLTQAWQLLNFVNSEKLLLVNVCAFLLNEIYV